MDLRDLVLEEISLDGLDGVTLESLWYYLNKTVPKFPLTLDSNSKKYLWENIIVQLTEVDFYELKEERETFEDVEAELTEAEIEIYKPSKVLQILPCHFVDNQVDRGSCSTYDTRVNITNKVRTKDRKCLIIYEDVVKKWGRKLVMVASQMTRERFLLQDTVDARIIKSKLTMDIYCNLEQIARARRTGLLGSDAYMFLRQTGNSNINHGLMGYARKKLIEYGLTVKVSYIVMKRTGKALRPSTENICYLRRFYTPRDINSNLYHRKVEEYLLAQPGRRQYMTKLCLDIKVSRKRLHKMLKGKSQFFELSYKRVSSEDILADDITFESVIKAEEKTSEEEVMDTTLSDNEANSLEKPPPPKKKKQETRNVLFVTLLQTVEEATAAEEAAEEEVGDESMLEVMTPQVLQPNVPYLVQIKDWMERLGPNGTSKAKLRETFSLHSLQARQIMKYLVKNPAFHCFYADVKRQKVERVCSSQYAAHHKSGTTCLTADANRKKATPNTSNDLPNKSEQHTPANSIRRSHSKGGGITNVTNKTIERNEIIVNFASHYRLILMPDLYKLVLASEADKYDTTIDRKTLRRRCEALHNENKIKILKTAVRVESKVRDLYYVCEPNMTIEDSLMQSSLEAQRSELASNFHRAKLDSEIKPKPKVQEKLKEKEEAARKLNAMEAFNTQMCSKVYGFAPKMKRLETLHKFLCYLIYNYEGKTGLKEQTEDSSDGMLSTIDIDKLTVYLDTDDWRRFLPPTSLCPDDPTPGIANILHLGTQLPLVLFLTLVRVPFKVPSIIEYLNDPIKRLIPVKYLNTEMKAALFHKRRYIEKLRDSISLLCMMGLVSNVSKVEGGRTFREISLIYVHQTAAIVDTSGGLISGQHTKEQVERLTLPFQITEGAEAVDNYWVTLQNICTSTPPKKEARDAPKSLEEVEPQRIDILRNSAMREYVNPKSLDEVQEAHIPGDGKGGGGLDTLFFSNLSRQWLSSLEKMVPNSFLPSAGKPAVKLSASANQHPVKVPATKVVVKPTLVSVAQRSSLSPALHKISKALNREKRVAIDQLPYMKKRRKVGLSNTPPSKRRKQRYEARRFKDDKDRDAIRNLRTLRSSFSPKEDEALLLAKIGLNILDVGMCKDPATKLVRDFLHRHFSVSKDKSSVACWARMSRLVKFGQKDRTLHLYTSIAMNDPEIASFKDQEPFTCTDVLAETYARLMELVLKRCENAFDNEVYVDLSTVADVKALMSKYNLIQVTETKDQPMVVTGHTHNHQVMPPIVVNWVHPTSDADVARYTLSNFATSFLLINDKINRKYQIHKVFAQYPTSITNSVFSTLQDNKVVNIKKNKNQGPMRMFGLTYRYKLFCDRLQVISMETFVSCGDAYHDLSESQDEHLECTGAKDWRGQLMTFLSLTFPGALDIKFYLPEKVLDTSNVNQSDDEEDNDDEDLADDSPLLSKKSEMMKFEHCQIKPCTIKAKLLLDNLPDELKVSKKEDRQYMRSLMSSIPYDMNTEQVFSELELVMPQPDIQMLKKIFSIIDGVGMAGISFYALYSALSMSSGNSSLSSEDLQNLTANRSKLEGYVNMLIERYLVLRVGVATRTYVAYAHRRMWVVHSLRDTKGRGSGVNLTAADEVRLEKLSDSSPSAADNLLETNASLVQDSPKPSTTYHRVDIIPKPWLTTEGTINYPVLYTLLTSLLSTINKNQSIQFSALHELFSMVYSPVALLDLLEILQDLRCVTCEYIGAEMQGRLGLFSKRIAYIVSDKPLRPDFQAHYTATHQSMQRLSLFMLNTRQNHGVFPSST